jgi:hypothetical protein
MAQEALVALDAQLQRILDMCLDYNESLAEYEDSNEDPLMEWDLELQESTIQQAVMSYRRND